MNLNHLRYFQSVCKHQNITKASKDIHVSQPSVTSAIKELEAEFGVQLFYRINNRISLTPEGEAFLKMTNAFLTNTDNFYSSALDLGAKRTVHLKLGIPTILGTFLLEKIVPEFSNLYPDIQLLIYEVPSLIGAKMLEEAELDLFIGIMDNTMYAGCDSKLIFQTNLVFSVSKNHPLAKEPSISEEMLDHQPLVIISKGSYHYKAISDKYKNTLLNIVLHSNQLSTISYMIKNNFAATILYEEVFEHDTDICNIPLSEPITANIGIFWQKNAYMSYAKQTFIHYIQGITAK